MAKDGAPPEVMSAAELKPLLQLSKRKPVPCAVGMTTDKQGVILLNRRTKPRKLMAELLRQAKTAGQDLERATIRFGRITVDGGSDSSTVHAAINKDAPGQLRPALLAKLRPAGFQRCEITVDAKLEDESDEDEPEDLDEAAHPPLQSPDPAPARQPAAKPDTPATPQPPAPTAQTGPDTNGPASGAQPDTATLRRELYSLAQQIVPVRAADPTRANDLLTTANAANISLKSGDLPKAQTAIETLRTQLQTAAPPPTPAPNDPTPDPLLTPIRQTEAPTSTQATTIPGPDPAPPPATNPPNAQPSPPDAHGRAGAPPPIDPASLPPGPLSKPLYETVGKRNRYLQTLYDPQSTEDRILSVVTGGLNDPANIITDAERAEHKALSAKIIETLNPRPTPEEARLDAMAASPLGTIASLATRGLGGNQQSQDTALALGGIVDAAGQARFASPAGQGRGPVAMASRRPTTGLPPRRSIDNGPQTDTEPTPDPNNSVPALPTNDPLRAPIPPIRDAESREQNQPPSANEETRDHPTVAPEKDQFQAAVPSTRGGDFERWFDELSEADFNKAWSDKTVRQTIQDRLRAPGGLHEWLPVSRADVFRRWGVRAADIKLFRSPTSGLRFTNPDGRHGGAGSTLTHNQIFGMIDQAGSFEDFVKRLNFWADSRMPQGRNGLPEGLRPP